MQVEAVKGECLVLCEDKEVRWVPRGLSEELIRVFGVPDIIARGPVVSFKNGVKIKLVDPISKDELVDFSGLPHVVLRGPAPGMSEIPPFVNVPEKEKRAPPPNWVNILDTAIVPHDEGKFGPWVIKWPGFTVSSGQKILRALLSLLKISVRIRIQSNPKREGFWRVYRAGAGRDIEGVRRIAGRKLRGSRYPWSDIKAGEPTLLAASSTANLQNNFSAWAKRRNIGWKVKFRTVGPGFIEATRQDDFLRLEEQGGV